MNAFIQAIDHVQVCIPIGEEDKARAFYTGILHLQEIEKPESLKKNGGLWYQVGTLQLHIGTERPTNEKSKRHVAFEVTDISKVRKYLERLNEHIKEDTPIPGVTRFSIFDPFNNRIELLEKTTVS